MRKSIVILLLVGVLSSLCTLAFAQLPPIEFHGYIQNRLYSTPGDALFFQSERLSLNAKACLPEDRIVYLENYWHPSAPSSGTYLESAYFDTPMGVGRLRAGKGRNLNFGITPSYPNRKTSNYGLFAEEFTQDRIYGVQYYVVGKPTEWGATVNLAPRIGSRNFGDPGVNAVPHFAERDLPGDLNRSLNFTGRVSHKLSGNLRVGASVEMGSLSSKDITSVNTLFSEPEGTVFTGDDRRRIGLDATYKQGSIFLQGEFMDAKTSDFDHDAWYITAGWEPTDPMDVRFYVRYAEANYDVPALSARPATWDKDQISLSVVQPISRSVWLQLEHEINDEQQFSADNNVTFLELFTGF